MVLTVARRMATRNDAILTFFGGQSMFLLNRVVRGTSSRTSGRFGSVSERRPVRRLPTEWRHDLRTALTEIRRASSTGDRAYSTDTLSQTQDLRPTPLGEGHHPARRLYASNPRTSVVSAT